MEGPPSWPMPGSRPRAESRANGPIPTVSLSAGGTRALSLEIPILMHLCWKPQMWSAACLQWAVRSCVVAGGTRDPMITLCHERTLATVNWAFYCFLFKFGKTILVSSTITDFLSRWIAHTCSLWNWERQHVSRTPPAKGAPPLGRSNGGGHRDRLWCRHVQQRRRCSGCSASRAPRDLRRRRGMVRRLVVPRILSCSHSHTAEAGHAG